jgi:hypothetical protein
MYRTVLAISDKGKCSSFIHLSERSISRYGVEWFEQANNPEKRIGIRPNVDLFLNMVLVVLDMVLVYPKYTKNHVVCGGA